MSDLKPTYLKQRSVFTGGQLWLCVLVFLVTLALFALPAQARQVRLPAGSFGAATSNPANPYPISARAATVAVDGATHDIYVGNLEDRRVEKFDAEGHFLFMFGAEVNKTAVETPGREAEEGICPALGHPADVCQTGAVTTVPGGFHGEGAFGTGILSVAVDNSSGPSAGDVYVGDFGGKLVSKFDEDGHLISSWGNNGPAETANGQLNGANATGPRFGPFGQIEGVGVDPTGNLWVNAPPKSDEFSRRIMFEFGQEKGKFIVDWNSNEGIQVGPAFDSEGNVYNGNQVVKYDPTGLELGSVYRDGFATSLAVDPSNDEIYAGVGLGTNPETYAVQRFDSSCHPALPVEGTFTPCTPAETLTIPIGATSLAVDPSSHALYVFTREREGSGQPAQVRVFAFQTVPDVTTAKASGFTASTATLSGTVNPSGLPVTECFFEWGEGTEPYEHTAECEPAAGSLGSGTSPVPVQAQISGLQPGHTYHFRLTAANANDSNGLVHQPEHGADLIFGPPKLESASALEVAASEAKLEGVVNPNNVDTHAHFEYGTEAGNYTNATPEVDLGDAASTQSFTTQLEGLQPHTTYHYRLVIESVLGAAEGPDLSFTTQLPSPFALPDQRGWEVVSPRLKLGTLAGVGNVQASPSGDAIAYTSSAPTELGAEGNGLAGDVSVLSGRGSSGWRSHDLAPLNSGTTGASVGAGHEVRFLSEDLSHSIVHPFGPSVTALSPEATEKTAFLRTDFAGGDPSNFCLASCYQPLVTASNVTPEGTPFGTPKGTPVIINGHECLQLCGPNFVAANPDLSHIVLASAAPLLEGAPAGEVVSGQDIQGSLYLWVAGHLQLLSIRPGAAGPAPASSVPVVGSTNSFGVLTARNAVSTDGSRVVWSEDLGTKHLYLRDVPLEQTVLLDKKQQGASGQGEVLPVFWAASTDDSRIFFTDTQRLTSDSGAESGKPDLYECKAIENEAGELECALTDLTPLASSESADVRGVIGASEDGSAVYFVANGVLATNTIDNGGGAEAAESGNCGTGPQAAQHCNLYLRREGQTTFIAGLAGEDVNDWQYLQGMPARVSPDGHWLAFMSQRSLTGYDNRDAVSGLPDQEAFLYHAPEGGEGELTCASCNPTGARPHGVVWNPGVLKLLTNFGYYHFGQQQGVAASLPFWKQSYKLAGPNLYQPPYLSNSGRLFFNSSDPLVPKDSNGAEDVYEYEQPGQGDCSESSVTFGAASGGCVNLLSSGTSSEESVFMDASESGDDAFILTASQLSVRDEDTAQDIYDVRVDGGEPEPVKPVECEGDGCQLPAAPPNDPTPGSLSFHGAGNVTPEATTRKTKKKKHQKKKPHKKQAKHRSAARKGENR